MGADQDELRIAWQKTITEAWKPYIPRFEEIWKHNDVAVFVHNPTAHAKRAARIMGWTGDKYAPVFRLTAEGAQLLANSDEPTRRWLARRVPGRIFLIDHDSTLLLNVTENGIEIEPGSTDAELQKSRS